MTHCPSCGSQVPEGKRFCGDCGTAAVEPSSAVTRTSVSGETPAAGDSPVRHPSPGPWHGLERGPSPHASPNTFAGGSTQPLEGRFLPGSVVASRYRIVALLGRGGMGEVFRADDLKLGQPVALKFLPEAMERDPSRLERFLNEVRVGLKVTHPNVCRLYDVGEIALPSTGPGQPSTSSGQGEWGQHFLSMEYVDGEDLSSLLRRIGRLPEDKAVQIARQLCAGLAAAHDQGILHRDLKPSNVMIDGRGRAKITDFGLAALAESLEGPEARSGTPGYMAPEQITGKEATARSDIYALGLVLYELFTGKRAFEAATVTELMQAQQESTPTNPSRVVDGLDPAVERAILNCLERDPADRPRSALAVAASLPGGDPLAAALAAGETPSPEMVAAAGPEGGMRTGVAIACLAAALLSLAMAAWLSDGVWIHSSVTWSKSFEALRDDAREIVQSLGWEEPPRNSTADYEIHLHEYLHHVRQADEPARKALAGPGQRVVGLFYRQAPRNLTPLNITGSVSADDPAAGPGDVVMQLDLRGRLLYLRVEPEPQDRSAGPDPLPDWGGLFEAAGLDVDEFRPTEPTIRPPVFADSRRAWIGALPAEDGRPVRIEAATLRGRPVYFRQVLPSDGALWSGTEESTNVIPEGLEIAVTVIVFSIAAGLLLGAVLLAIRSLRLGRGDRRGALKMAVGVFGLRMLGYVFSGHHVAGLEEIYIAVVAFAGALTLAASAWMLYVGLEPYVRRFWPEAMVSWSRFLAGRFRDPLVGRDLLIGLVFPTVVMALFFTAYRFAASAGAVSPIPDERVLTALKGGRFAIGALFSAPLTGLVIASFITLLFLLLRIVVRRTWLAAALLCMVWGGLQGISWAVFVPPDRLFAGVLLGVVSSVIVSGALVFVLVRFGFLALMADFVLSSILESYAFTADVSAPHFTTTLIGPAVAIAVGIFAFRAAVSGRPYVSGLPESPG